MKFKLILIFSFLISGVWAQHKHKGLLKGSAYTYIYRLTTGEAEKLQVQPQTKIDSTYFHTLFDSVIASSTYTHTPPPGYYLFVASDGLDFRYQLINTTALEVHILNNGRDFAVRVTDKNTEEIVKDARLTLSGKPVPYDPSTGSYTLPGKQKKGKLHIEARGEILFMNALTTHTASRKNDKTDATGFIAFSRPRYRLKDTVFLKTYIQYKGKPMQEELELRVRKSGYYSWDDEQTVYKTRIRAATPGAYVCRFVLSDTFKLDETYAVHIYRTNRKKTGKNQELFTSTFRTEDYQLDQTKYKIRCKKHFIAGDTVPVFLSGTDFNGLPLFDASADVEVLTEEIIDPAQESEDFAFRVYQKTLTLDPAGETRVDIPPNLFSVSGAFYKIRVKFRNSNNEIHSDSLVFQIQQQVKKLELVDLDSLYEIRYSKKGKEEPGMARITYLGKNRDSLLTVNRTLPIRLKLPGRVLALQVKCDDLTEEFEIPFKTLHAYGYRNKDSVFAGVENPASLLFNYELYRAGILLQKGCVRQFTYKAADPGHTPYKLVTRVCNDRENKCEILNILPQEHSLQVDLKQVPETWPGQEAEVKVQVRDYDSHPVKEANITLDCINAQFNENDKTTVPDYNQKQELKKKQYIKYTMEMSGYQQTSGYKTYWYKRLRLDTIPYYHLHNPGTELYSHSFPVSGVQAQFAPFVVSKNNFQQIYFIFIDDKPVFALGSMKMKGSYYQTFYDRSPWSFQVSEGMHTVRIRTLNKEYTLPSLQFSKGQKLEVSFDQDHLPLGITETSRSKRLTPEESKVVGNNLFVVDDLPHYAYEDQYFWQGSNFKVIRDQSMAVFQPGDTIHYQLGNYNSTTHGFLIFQPGLKYEINEEGATTKYFTAPVVKLRSGSFYNYERTGDTLVTAAVLRKSPEFTYGNKPYGTCAEGLYTEPDNGSYMLLEQEGAEVYRMELVRTDQMDAVVGYQRDVQSGFGGKKKRIENLKPGLYKATYYDEDGNFFVKNSIHILSGKMHLDKIHKENFKPFSAYTAEDVKCEFYDLQYGRNSPFINGTIVAPSRLDYVTTYVMHNGRVIGSFKPDTKGNFHFRVNEPGQYDLFIVPDTTYQNMSLFGLQVSKGHAPVINIRLTPSYDTVHHYSLYNLAYQGRNVEMHSHVASGEHLPFIGVSEVSDTRQPLNHAFGIQGETVSRQYFYDGTRMEVDGYTLNAYYRRQHSVHYRTRSYASHYSSFYRAAPAKGKFRASFGERSESSGWNYNNAKEGAFARRAYDPSDNDEDGVDDKPDFLSIRGNTIPPLKINSALFDKDFSHDLNPDYLYKGNNKKGPARQMRKSFSDCAYWAPNLLTNDSGEVSYRFRFPDD
ncbi:MAG TPA: hypothetical protein VNZ86_10585, partial [Bacteroidia bacterium]|nr:hypothetical protein [Bacteroidia bacterium]